ncbi:MAG: hypothetical protein IPM42_15045 [Saprospiraceae bacterium]|nr:hypothetical protein [Saprospiraceae bacterium]
MVICDRAIIVELLFFDVPFALPSQKVYQKKSQKVYQKKSQKVYQKKKPKGISKKKAKRYIKKKPKELSKKNKYKYQNEEAVNNVKIAILWKLSGTSCIYQA